MPRVRRPLCFAAVFYALGLLAGGRLPDGCMVALLALSAAGAAVCARKGRMIAFLFLSMAFLCVGALRMDAEQKRVFVPPEDVVCVTARVRECVQIEEEEAYAVLFVDRMRTQDGEEIAPGQCVRLTVRISPEHLPAAGGTITAQEVRLSALRGQRNPGGFDQEAYYRSRGVVMLATAGEKWTCEAPGALNPYAMLDRLKSAASERIDRLFAYTAPLYRGMLLGDRDGMDETVYAQIRRSGAAHLLAVSGLHMSALMGFVLFLTQRRQCSLRVSCALALAALWGYGLLAGLGAGTLRACIMGTLLVGARALHARYDTPCALAAAFLLMTLINPWYIRDTGFVLSFATVGGMLLFVPALRGVFKKLPEKIADTLSFSLGVQLASLPFQMLFFGEISLVGVLANLVCVPFATALVVGAMALIALSVLLAPAAMFLAPVFRIGAAALQGIMQAASNIPFACVRVAAPHAVLIAAYEAIAFLASPYFDRRLRTRLIGAGAVAACCAVFACALQETKATRYVTLDVGQGDSAVLCTRQGAVCVVDTGPTGSTELTRYLHHEGLSIDVLVLSHLDSDHAGGIVALSRSGIPVGKIVLPYGVEGADPAILEALASLTAQGGVLYGAGRGDALEVPGAQLAFLWPAESAHGSNERSLATRIHTQNVTILSMGDVPADSQPLRGVACDVLKVAHHGSRDGTSALFLERADPRLALISVGRNAFGHPSDEALSLLCAQGVQTLRTDERGAITLTLENGSFHVHTMLDTGE